MKLKRIDKILLFVCCVLIAVVVSGSVYYNSFVTSSAPADEDILTYESSTGNFEWHTKAELSLSIGSDIQAWDDDLDDIAALTPTDSYFVVGNGSDWVTESGSTARDSLSLGTGDSPQFTGVELGHASDTTLTRNAAGDADIEGNAIYRAGGTDVPVTDGGTGAGTFTDGGVLLGSGASAFTAMSALADGEFVVGDGTTDPVAESGATARTSMGVGTGDSPTFTGLTLSGNFTPSASGGSDLGSTLKEVGDVYMADDKKLYLGSDQDAYFEYDSTDDVVYLHGKALAATVAQTYGVTWDESGDSYTRTGALTGVAKGSSPGDALVPIQAAMRRCILNDSGEVVYYLDPSDSTKKEGGGTATLDGTDGQVMVQIPAFYYKYGYSGTTHTWEISATPRDGFSLHPAFQKNGSMVEYRYIGAYEAVAYDAGDAAYEDGTGAKGTQTWSGGIDTGNDMIGSVSGFVPLSDETRPEYRSLASNRGTGWRQMDYYLASAVQLLYLIEYADFDSQTTIGTGNTSYSGWDFGECIADTGMSNSDGDATNASDTAEDAIDELGSYTNGVEVSEYMAYRGIENFYGSLWEWEDGINVNGNVPYFSNTDTDFADGTSTNYYDPGITLWSANGYPGTLEQIPDGFLPAGSGGGSSTHITDYYYQSTGWRVVRLGGSANSGARAGAFCVAANSASSNDGSYIGGRLSR